VLVTRSRPTPKRRLRCRPARNSPPLVLAPDNGYTSPPEVLDCLPLPGSRGNLLQFHSFDEDYLVRLREGDFLIQEHFRKYFTALMHVKLRFKLKSPEAIEDVQQETFARFYVALRGGKIREPKSLGSYVNSMCNNIVKEAWRPDPTISLDDDDAPDFPALHCDVTKILADKQAAQKIHRVIEQLPKRDRRVLRAIYFDERDKDDVCREFGITRDNLRLLLHRAIQRMKHLYDDEDD
jgi:RNA polymerase sigma-70 factor (ECF subfamily)